MDVLQLPAADEAGPDRVAAAAREAGECAGG
jgi:hypothetical protein